MIKNHDDLCLTNKIVDGNCHMSTNCNECREIWTAAQKSIIEDITALVTDINSDAKKDIFEREYFRNRLIKILAGKERI